MNSFSGKVISAFLIFLGCSIFWGTISCNCFTQGPNTLSQHQQDSCCFDSGSQNPHGPIKIICAESPRTMNALSFIKQQYDNHQLSLSYYPVLTPKMIHLLDSLNTVRGSFAPNYYAFVFETDSELYTIPFTSSEIKTGQISAPDSVVLMQVSVPPPCYYPHCAPKHILIIKDTLTKK